ncbi:MAG: membrane protein insertase YidC [Lachnospiraceae bacterium]|nr:membrane protein insertase YidC [Lachnospiraceae bacterium]
MLLDILYSLTITPIQMIIEFIFTVMYRIFENPGVAIIFVSISVQLLVLPLYKQSDAMQEQERNKQKEMERWIKHIKKTFKGDERFMMLQAYYREVGYKPVYAIKGSFSLLLQIPFFMAAYNYLSNLSILENTGFLVISDLSRPDGLINIGGLSINLLPILMTVFNIISGIIYTKGFPLKDKVQTYGLAAVFLVLLYQSPSGLVFYWTLNNLFSLLKNLFMKIIKNPRPVINIFTAVVGGVVFGERFVKFFTVKSMEATVSGILFVVCLLPLGLSLWEKIRLNMVAKGKLKEKIRENRPVTKEEKSLFTTAAVLLTVILGVAIPISIIGSSPTEFFTDVRSPLQLLVSVLAVMAGFVLVWFRIFYSLCTDNGKRYFAVGLAVLGLAGLVNFYGFSLNLGTLSTVLVYDKRPYFSFLMLGINAVAVIAVIALVIVLFKKKIVLLKRLCQIAALTLFVVGIVGSGMIISESANYKKPQMESAEEAEPIYHLSKNGKNVVVFMLDRAISGYIPYLMQEKPELASVYEGFTYYPNTVSFGGNTNFGAPALFGGYEYLPKKMNDREELLLEQKHDEALKVMPAIFGEKGYKVTITDPPYAGYKWDPDLSIYDGMKNVSAYKTEGQYLSLSRKEHSGLFDDKQKHNFIYYSFMKIVPISMQDFFYDEGNYYNSSGTSVLSNGAFFNWYSSLENMVKLTDISEGDENNFLLLQNGTTHEATPLKEPEYVPQMGYELHIDPKSPRFVYNGVKVDVSRYWDYCHYQVNMAALLRVGEWIQYMKDNGVYDNTRIIIVSDHGYPMRQFDYMLLNNGIDVERFNPLLLVKDFGSTGAFKWSNEFMTNADVPTMTMAGLVEKPVNPYTGNAINSDYKTSGDLLITTSEKWSTRENNGFKFNTTDGFWYRIKPGSIFDVNNWERVSKGDK